MNPILWQPSTSLIESCQLTQYLSWLSKNGYPTFRTYEELYEWSITDLSTFWKSLAAWADITFDRPEQVVLKKTQMPGAKWFEGAKLNFARNLLAYYIAHPNKQAIVSISESGESVELTGQQLLDQVASVTTFLKSQGVGAGDRVAAYLPNTHHAAIAMLATTSIGAIWSSCSPDFGVGGVVDRFGQIEPKVLFTIDGYSYNGKKIDCLEKVAEIQAKLPTLVATVFISYKNPSQTSQELSRVIGKSKTHASWEQIIQTKGTLTFESTDFDHPVYILYSSGTTGVPKCIVHGVGGVLFQHAKELRLHTNLSDSDRFMYFTTTGWMMWNWMVSGLMVGATLVLYEGSPSFPTLHRLWDIVSQENISVFGTSAKFIGSCRNQAIFEKRSAKLKALNTILSTGSPLLPEDFDWIYSSVKKDVWLASISGGTDIVSCFFLGNPLLPVRRNELQCRGLGMAVETFDEAGNKMFNAPGELVCTKPAPSMPIYFWNDKRFEKYNQAYFDVYPGIWRHGDYVVIYDHGGATIKGRSDATLNPSGVRIGTAEIYRQVETMPEIQDSLVVGQSWKGDVRIVLFVVLNKGHEFSEALKEDIKTKIKQGTTPRHVPEKIIQIQEVPYTRSGKKVELAVTKVIHGKTVENQEALANPESLRQFKNIVELQT